MHYGLPAVGVICLFMLRPTFWHSYGQALPISKVLQDLGVFASEVQIGGLLQAGFPNYALLYRATSTIQSFLRAALSPEGPFANFRRTEHVEEDPSQQEMQPQMEMVPFDLSAYADLWAGEYDFWQDLGAHPSLLTPQVSGVIPDL